MSMMEVLATLREEVKEDYSRYLPWTCIVLERDLLKGLRTVIVIEYAKTMRQKKEERTWETEKDIRIQLPILQYTERTILMVN